MHHTEYDIELLAVRADLREADPHLRECAACREKLEFILRLHAGFVEASAAPPDPRIADRLAGNPKPGEIRLTPYHPPVEVRMTREHHHIPLLAARSDPDPGAPPETAAVFASEADGVLLRVVAEPAPGVFRLFLLADDPKKQALNLIGLVTPSGYHTVTATDVTGAAVLESREHLDWNRISVLLSLPVTEFALDAPLVPGEQTDPAGTGMLVEANGTTLRIRFRSAAVPAFRRALVLHRTGMAELLESVGGSFLLSTSSAATATAVRLFA
jgi:hypothetical protein